MIIQEEPDATVIAAGAELMTLNISGVENAVSALDILAGNKEAGEKVVIIGGGMVGCETADFLSQNGREVTILEMLDSVGADIGPNTRWVLMGRLRESGVRITTRTKAIELTAKGVVALQDGLRNFLAADTIVVAVGMQNNAALFHDLRDKLTELYLVGDCFQPGKIGEAVQQGFQVGLGI